MKTIKQITDLESFINGVIATTELGDTIDECKELEFKAVKTDAALLVKFVWIKGLTTGRGDDPRTMIDDKPFFGEHHINLLLEQSQKTLAYEVVEAIEKVNENKFIYE
jgi:hypothetical protein